MAPKLSICMPTYNRAHLIERAFASVLRLRALGVDLEVVIGDNASTDDTPATVARLAAQHGFVRPFRNSRNLGSLVNYQLCLRRSRGDYALYLADDDTLVPEAVVHVLRMLDARPDLSMAVLSFQVWDDTEDRGLGAWPNLKEPVVIGRDDFGSAFHLFLNDIVLPEIVVMRRPVIEAIVAEQVDAYYAFTNFAHALSRGNVWLYDRPAYRFHTTTQHSMDSEGWNVAVGSFEEFRAGLEYCLLHMNRATPLTPEQRAAWKARIEVFIQRRMLNAGKRLILRREPRKAVTVLQRLSLWVTDERARAELRELAATALPEACADDVLFLAREGLGARWVALHADQPDDPPFFQIVTAVLAREGLQRIGLGEAVQSGAQERTVVLVQRPDLVPATVAAGFPAPNVLVPSGMIADFHAAFAA